jgi:HK97 family phage prohead protease
MPQKFVDQRLFRELAAAGDTAGVGVEHPARVLRTGEEGSRTVRFCLSDSSVDRMGDTIRAAGWHLAPYKANPVVLWSHMSSAPPIGRMVNVWISGDRLLGDVRFPDAVTYEFGDQVFRLIKAGYINAGSVGFWPLKFSFSDDEDRPWGVDYHEQELLEFSITPVPANQNAYAAQFTATSDVDPTVFRRSETRALSAAGKLCRLAIEERKEIIDNIVLHVINIVAIRL